MHSCITPRHKQQIDTLPGFWGAKDLQSTYLSANQTDAELVGLQDQNEIIGMTDLDLPCGVVESAHLFRAQDREVIKSGQSLRILDIHRDAGDQWRTMISTKMPLCDEEKNVVWIVYQLQELDSSDLLKLGMLLGKIADRPKEVAELYTSTSYVIGHPRAGPKLTRRQEEILFLLLRGRSARLIAHALDIATRTVEWHLCLIKEKFAVSSKSELIDKAIELSFLHHLPPGLSKRSLSIILREEG